jgi:hypothetical protein
MQEYKAPEYPVQPCRLFLAGSIEMGRAVQWQEEVVNHFKNWNNLNIMNPRRDNWDSSWKQSIGNPDFREQVNWELNMLQQADVVAVYFDKDTMSPITLLELGLHARDQKLVVCCPDGFWRQGNVEIVCNRFAIPFSKHIRGMTIQLQQAIEDFWSGWPVKWTSNIS